MIKFVASCLLCLALVSPAAAQTPEYFKVEWDADALPYIGDPSDLTVVVLVDDEALGPVNTTCNETSCSWPVTGEFLRRLLLPGPHSVRAIIYPNDATLPSFPLDPVVIKLNDGVCNYVPPSGGATVQRPAGYKIQGTVPLNRVAGDNYAVNRVWELRDAGWYVDIVGLSGTSMYITARCQGR